MAAFMFFLCGLPFSGIGLLVIMYGPKKTFTCQRIGSQKGNCQLIYSNLLGSKAQEIPLNSLLGAAVRENDETTYVAILTKDGDFDFTDSSNWGHEHKYFLAHEINDFVNNVDRKSLNVNYDGRFFMWMFGGAFLLSGLSVMGLGMLMMMNNNPSAELPSSVPVPTELNVSESPTEEKSSPFPQPSSQLPQAPVSAQKDNFTKLINLGYAYYEKGDYQTALINFNRALQVRPGDADAVKAVNKAKSALANPSKRIDQKKVK